MSEDLLLRAVIALERLADVAEEKWKRKAPEPKKKPSGHWFQTKSGPWELGLDDHEVFLKLYPHLDISREYDKMRAWIKANPQKMKTAAGMKRFISGWLERADENNPIQKKVSGTFKTPED